MVKITKVYTKCGDSGMTHLAGGTRVLKTCARIEAIGEIDELNSHIGFAVSAMREDVFTYLKKKCLRIQGELFNLGAQLVVLQGYRRENTPMIVEDDIKQLEVEIDQSNLKLKPLSSFILPGGGEVATRLHMARAVCRRSERAVLTLLDQKEELDGTEIPYLNRLSDWLFVTARLSSVLTNSEEFLWASH